MEAALKPQGVLKVMRTMDFVAVSKLECEEVDWKPVNFAFFKDFFFLPIRHSWSLDELTMFFSKGKGTVAEVGPEWRKMKAAS